MPHQQVHGRAKCRIRADARIAVRTAALQAQRQVAGRDGHAHGLVGLGQRGLDPCDAFAHRLHRAALALDRVGRELVAALEFLRRHEARDLVRLAAQPDDLHGMKIRMASVAGHGPAKHVHGFTLGGHAAAGFMRQRDHAVDVGVVAQAVPEVVGHHTRHRGRAIYAGEDADVVARRNAPVGPNDALEGGRRLHVLGRLGIDAKSVVALEIAHREVVDMNVVAGGNVLRGEADDLVVAPHRLALGHGAHGDLVSRRHGRGDPHVGFLDERRPGRNFDARDDHIIGGIQPDGQVCGLQHGQPLRRIVAGARA